MRRLAMLGFAGCISVPDPPACDPTKPQPMAELNSPGADINPWMSPDRLEILFTSNRDGTYTIYRATRSSPGEMFAMPVRLDSPQPPAFDAVVSSDGKKLWWVEGNGTVGGDVHEAQRDPTPQGFSGNTQVFPELGKILHPSFTDHETTIVFAAEQTPGDLDLFMANRSGSAFPNRKRLSVSITSQIDGHPSITPDGVTLRYDLQLDAQSITRLRGATRAGDDFTAPFDIDVGDTQSDELTPFIHPDSRTLVFASSRPGGGGGGYDLWIACE